MASVEGKFDWRSFHADTTLGEHNDWVEAPLDFFDTLAEGYFGEPSSMIEFSVAAEGVLLIPGPARTVRCFHSLFQVGEELIGIWGPSPSAPFISINTKAASDRVDVPARPNTRKKDDMEEIFVPSLSQFMDCEPNDKAFGELKGKAGVAASSLNRSMPKSFWIHMALFVNLFDARETKARDLAHRVIAFGRTNQDIKDGLYKLLVFLWAIERGFARSVAHSIPKDTEELDEIREKLLSDFQEVERERRKGGNPEGKTPSKRQRKGNTPDDSQSDSTDEGESGETAPGDKRYDAPPKRSKETKRSSKERRPRGEGDKGRSRHRAEGWGSDSSYDSDGYYESPRSKRSPKKSVHWNRDGG